MLSVVEKNKRIQVALERTERNLLRDWSAQISKEQDIDIGVGPLAAKLLTSLLVNHPELIRELISEEYNQSAPPDSETPKRVTKRTPK